MEWWQNFKASYWLQVYGENISNTTDILKWNQLMRQSYVRHWRWNCMIQRANQFQIKATPNSLCTQIPRNFPKINSVEIDFLAHDVMFASDSIENNWQVRRKQWWSSGTLQINLISCQVYLNSIRSWLHNNVNT